jgi:peptidyl-prolyl cis-trans isomerase C
MSHYRIFYFKGRLWLILIAILLSACGTGAPPTIQPGTTENARQTPSETSPDLTEIQRSEEAVTPSTETPMPQPLAASVNGVGITLAEFDAELGRFAQAAGSTASEADRQRVLDELINQELLAQAAAENGFLLDPATLQARLEKLTDQAGGPEVLAAWMKANGYGEPDFRQQLGRAIAAAWMRDRITAEVGTTAEQVHTRQILLRSAQEAGQALARLQAGGDFVALAKEYDPLTGGELGWLPRGVLYHPALDEALFKLEAGQYSAVIETQAGFHILYAVERDPNHSLDPQARLILQETALQRWLAERRQQSSIEVISR